MATPKVKILSDGSMRGLSFELTNETYSVGRSESCDICIPDSTISGHHASLVMVGEGTYVLRDEGSTNGSRLNSARIEPGEEHTLSHGDIFQLGGIELMYDSGDALHTAARRTTSVIQLENASSNGVSRTTTSMRNMDAKASGRKKAMMRENRGHKVLFYALIGILGLGAVVVLLYFLMSIL